ncbi:MAG: hypothetical protein ACODAA_07810, partial [Gemmatimonadota bacterium]
PYRFTDLTIDRFSRPGETAPSTGSRPGNMERITVEDVVEKLELAMSRYVGRSRAAVDPAAESPSRDAEAAVDPAEAT